MTGTALVVEPATDEAVLDAADASWRVTFTSATVTGAPSCQTGLVHVPHGRPPKGGWPVVTYGHMTTGGSDRSAPSRATLDHPELRRMTQGNVYVSRLLEAGVSVLQPDYEGIGGPGPHPYLIGASLAGSVGGLLVAAREEWPLARRWVSAGHSEGAVAALHAATRPPPDLNLRAVCAFAPVTRMDLTIGASLRLPVVPPGFAVVSALIALMISGAATVSSRLAALVVGGGLSEAARERWHHLDERCLEELCAPDSFGSLAPRALLGPRGAEVRDLLLTSFRENEVARLRLPACVPLRIDAARFDEVAPFWLTRNLVRQHRAAGTPVSADWWSTMHSPVLRSDRAPGPAARWTLDQLAL